MKPISLALLLLFQCTAVLAESVPFFETTCESHQLGLKAVITQTPMNSWVKTYDQYGTLLATRATYTDRVPGTSDAQAAYIGASVERDPSTGAFQYNIQVGPAGKVDWQSSENKNRCFAKPPVEGFWILANGAQTNQLTLSSDYPLNPRAKGRYSMLSNLVLVSARMDGKRCPKMSDIADHSKYDVSCTTRVLPSN